MPALRTRGTSGAAAPVKPRSDAYVGLLVIALLAQLAGIIFLYLEHSEYPDNPPKTAPVNLAAPAGAPQAPQQAAPGGVQPGARAPAAPPVPARQQPAVAPPPSLKR